MTSSPQPNPTAPINFPVPDLEDIADELHLLATKVRRLWDNPVSVRSCDLLFELHIVQAECDRIGARRYSEDESVALRTVLSLVVDAFSRALTYEHAMIYFGLDEEHRAASLGKRRKAIEGIPSDTWRRGYEQRLFTTVASELREAERELQLARAIRFRATDLAKDWVQRELDDLIDGRLSDDDRTEFAALNDGIFENDLMIAVRADEHMTLVGARYQDYVTSVRGLPDFGPEFPRLARMLKTAWATTRSPRSTAPPANKIAPGKRDARKGKKRGA